MKAEKKQETVITLKLTEEEARWLKGMVQNPLIPNELPREAEIRKRFWYALYSVLPSETTS